MALLLRGVVASLLLTDRAGGSDGSSPWGPVARLAIFEPTLGESVTTVTAAGHSEQLDFHLAVVGARNTSVQSICFDFLPGHQKERVPLGYPHCIDARQQLVHVSGLSTGDYTLATVLVWQLQPASSTTPIQQAAVTTNPSAEFGFQRTFFSVVNGSSAAPAAASQAVSFFVASTISRRGAGGGGSSLRMMACTASELMFRSSGSSNYGSNYPGFWFPTAGICPSSFQQLQPGGGGGSFRALHGVLQHADGEAVSRWMRQEDFMFDKRFSAEYHSPEYFARRSVSGSRGQAQLPLPPARSSEGN